MSFEVNPKPKQSKNRAYFAMCLSSLLLLVISALAESFSTAAVMFLSKNALHLQTFITNILVMFGVAASSSLAAAKYFLSSGIIFQFVSLVSVIVTMVLPAFVFSKALKMTFDDTFPVNGKLISGFAAFFCLTQLITNASAGFAGSIYDYLVPEIPGIYNGTFTPSAPDAFSFFMSILVTGILVPICEEYVFRGVVFTYLKRYGIAFGIIGSAVIFGVAHSAPTQSVFAFVFGVISAFCFAVTGNIKTSIALHSLNNVSSVIFGYLSGFLGEISFSIVYCIYTALITAASLFGMFLLLKKDGIFQSYRNAKAQNDDGILTKAGMKEIFAFPLLLYIAYYAIDFILQVM